MKVVGPLLLLFTLVLIFSRTARMDLTESFATTNAEDQAEASALKARLAERRRDESFGHHNKSRNQTFRPVTPVRIAPGAHKYVLISARVPNDNHSKEQYFVTSKRGASYHRNAAAPFVHDLEEHGYQDIQIVGGGRLLLDEDAKKISIFGFSYSFGQPDHEISKRVVQEDSRYADYDITTSNEGY